MTSSRAPSLQPPGHQAGMWKVYCCSVKDSPPVCLNPVCLDVPFCQPFVITRHSSWLFRLHCVVWDVAGTRCQRCGVAVQQGVGTAEGSKRTAVAVCSRCQLDTRRTEKIARRLKTRYLYVQLYF